MTTLNDNIQRLESQLMVTLKSFHIELESNFKFINSSFPPNGVSSNLGLYLTETKNRIERMQTIEQMLKDIQDIKQIEEDLSGLKI